MYEIELLIDELKEIGERLAELSRENDISIEILSGKFFSDHISHIKFTSNKGVKEHIVANAPEEDVLEEVL